MAIKNKLATQDFAKEVLYAPATLTPEQKAQAQKNIGMPEITTADAGLVLGVSEQGTWELSLVSGGGSGEGGVQSDWNVENKTSLAYIKNKPFYDNTEVLLDTITVNNGDELELNIEKDIGIQGETVTIVWDGISSEKIINYFRLKEDGAWNYHLAIGNRSYANDSFITFDDTGEEYLIKNRQGHDTSTIICDDQSHTLSIVKGLIFQIDEKFIPDTIARKSYVDEKCNSDVTNSLNVTLSSDELLELDSTISTLQSLKKANTSVIAFLADLHMAGWTIEKIKKAVAGYNKISSSVKTDLLLLGGDYLDNSSATTKEQALAQYADLRDVTSHCNNKPPMAVIKGNHDDNTMYTDYINGLVDAETFWDTFGNIDDDRTVRNAGNIEDCYGYYDIPNQKVRVFYVNTVDLPQKLIEVTNSVNYKGQWDTGISVEQLQFIADNLKFDTSGWHVMVFSHHPIMRDIAIENGCGVQADRGGAALLELLDKFNTGNTSGSIAVTGIDFAGTVNYDFTNNQDCKIVACVNGHTHRDNVEVYNNSFFCISTRAVYGHPSYDGHISSSAYFVVDRNNTKLHLVYNGDGEENVFDYSSLNTGEVEPSEPVYEEIASPFEWEIAIIDETTGVLKADPEEMRISSTKIVGFTTPAVIDMSGYSGAYAFYLYDTNGNYIECSTSWINTTTPFELPVDRTVRFKIRNNNYELWTDENINEFASAIKAYVEEGGEAYVESDEPVIELGKPLENVLYLIGGSVSSQGSAGVDVYMNDARMTALVTHGVKPLTDINTLCDVDVYFIAIPTDATKITVICPDFIPGLQYYNYENNAYTKVADPGWITPGGLEYSFEAGAYSHVAINFKNSSNTTIPTDTDTSGFSIIFE